MKVNGCMKVILSSKTKEVSTEFFGYWKTKHETILNKSRKYVLNFYLVNSNHNKDITYIEPQEKLTYQQLIELIYQIGQQLIEEHKNYQLTECYVTVRLV